MIKWIKWFLWLRIFGTIVGQCIRPVVRRELSTLNDDDRNRFFTALRILHSKRQASSTSRYDRYAQIHISSTQEAHGQPQFLPWHRQFIRDLEKELQVIDADVVIPFWDWSRASEHPEQSYIFGPSYLGGNGRFGDKCVMMGPFAGWQMSTPSPHCLARDFDLGNAISPFVSRNVILQLLKIDDFATFSERLEVAHGAIHTNIGGRLGDMLPMWSPNDPIFFLHHVFIDMLWWNWQRLHPNTNAYNGFRNGREVRVSDIMRPFGVSVGSVLNTNNREHCYIYPYYQTSFDAFSRSGIIGGITTGLSKSPAKGRKYSSPRPKPLSRTFIEMSNMEVERVRQIEDEFRKMDLSS